MISLYKFVYTQTYTVITGSYSPYLSLSSKLLLFALYSLSADTILYRQPIVHEQKDSSLICSSQKQLPENLTCALYNNEARLHFARQLFL